MDNYTFYVINLNRSKSRWEDMVNHYDRLVRVEAYDGKLLKDYKDIKYARYNYKETSELGCSLSHVKAIKTAYEAGLQEVFILEDDILNTYRNKWRYLLREILNHKPRNAECIIFFCMKWPMTRNLIRSRSLFRPYMISGVSTGAYYINRAGMKKICSRYVHNGIIDFTRVRLSLVADQNLIYNYINTYHYTLPTFIDKLQPSTIHGRQHVAAKHFPNNKLIKQYFSRVPYYNRYLSHDVAMRAKRLRIKKERIKQRQAEQKRAKEGKVKQQQQKQDRAKQTEAEVRRDSATRVVLECCTAAIHNVLSSRNRTV